MVADPHMPDVWGLQSFGHGHGITEYDMPPRRRLPPTAEIAVRAHMEPVLLQGGETVKSLSTAFLADLEEDWRQHGKEIFPVLREKYPQAYFQGIMSLARIIRWDVDRTGAFDRTLSPEEIMDKLEQRVGPEGRKLFEQFLRKVNKLQAQQQLEAQAQMGVTERSRERGPG
jgi:2-polyprenyl-3-methyl-5-hydroxy-6-metoxy-1,4-benzoquinol methylase